MPKSALILAILILAIITGGVHAAASSSQPAKITFSSVLDETHRIEQRMRAEIARNEKLQPDWDSKPIKAELDKAVRTLESTETGDYLAYQEMRILSCQTPLLDYDLVKSASEMFQALYPWYHQKHVFWILSGNDTIVFLPSVPRHCRDLHAFLTNSIRSHGSEIIEMLNLSHQCTDEATKGDTAKANSYLWEILKLAESSGDYRLNVCVLALYERILRSFATRPHPELYESKMAYVQQELPCVMNDTDFVATLDGVQKDCDPVVVKQLREAHADMVAKRRSGDRKATNELCFKLIELAGKAGDQTEALQYFALNAYHTYLKSDPSSAKNYEQLSNELFSAWAVEELGRQPFETQENFRRKGDWKNLESAFKCLEQQSILVCRWVRPCHTWGESSPRWLLKIKQKTQSMKGLVYYQVVGPDLTLYCLHSNDLDPSPIVASLMTSLKKVGLRPMNPFPGVVQIDGSWLLGQGDKKLSD